MSNMHRSSRTPGARRRIVSSAVACLAIVLLSSAARAGSTVLQFGQTNPSDVVTASESGGVTMLSTGGNTDGGGVSIPVVITNFLGVPGVSIPAFETYVNVTSTGTASTFLGQAFQGFTGTIEITSGIGGTGSNFLTATFPDTANPGTFSGTLGGTQAQLSATAPPQTLQLSSDFATFLAPLSMTIGFSNVAPGLGITSGSIAPFTAQNTGTFGAAAVPEPGTFGMACTAILIGGFAIRTYRRKRT